MIVVDTNVISELMRANPEQLVLDWIDAQFVSSLFVTAVTEAEILTGIALLPEGRRKNDIIDAAQKVFAILFAGHVLVFDSIAAYAYAEIYVQRHSSGKPISQADCQIAAIARSQETVIATRNVTDFEGLEVELINPCSNQESILE